MKNLIKKSLIICAAVLCANFSLALNIPSGLANAAAAAQNANASEKASVMKLMQDVQNSFSAMDRDSTVADLKNAVASLKKIDTSKCPAAVKEKFKTFCGELESYAESASKLLDEYKIKDTDVLEDIVKSNPNLAEKFQKYSDSVKKAGKEFMASAMPYLQ